MPNSTSIRPVYRTARCVFISNYPFDSNCYQCGESREAHDDPPHLMPTQPNHNASAATSAQEMVRITFAEPGSPYRTGDIGYLTGLMLSDASKLEVAFSDSGRVLVPRGNVERMKGAR